MTYNLNSLPEKSEPYTDVYFLRSLQVLQNEDLNPFVRYQIFFRGNPGKIYGVEEALSIISKYSNLKKNGGRILSLQEGEEYSPGESVLVLEGRVCDIITLETMVLGVLSAETTKINDSHDINLRQVSSRISEIVSLVSGRPVLYMGARHWRYDRDENISKAAFAGGASDVSTEIGAATQGKKAAGTIPHALEVVFDWKYRTDKAVLESIQAFDLAIDPSVPRIALVDYANREIDDGLRVAHNLGKKLYGIRIDTANENRMQRVQVFEKHVNDPFWNGNGVTIGGVLALRKALDENDFDNVKIVLTNGFGNPTKVKAFVKAEVELGVRLFDVLGVGNVFDARIATMDIVGVGESLETIKSFSKVGRKYQPNNRLVLR